MINGILMLTAMVAIMGLLTVHVANDSTRSFRPFKGNKPKKERKLIKNLFKRVPKVNAIIKAEYLVDDISGNYLMVTFEDGVVKTYVGDMGTWKDEDTGAEPEIMDRLDEIQWYCKHHEVTTWRMNNLEL